MAVLVFALSLPVPLHRQQCLQSRTLLVSSKCPISAQHVTPSASSSIDTNVTTPKLFEIQDKIFRYVHSKKYRNVTYEPFRRNPHWASVPLDVMRRSSCFRSNPSHLPNLSDVSDLRLLRRGSNVCSSLLQSSYFTSDNVHQLFGIDSASVQVGHDFKPNRRTITNMWKDMVDYKRGRRKTISKSSNRNSSKVSFNHTSFEDMFKESHLSNAIQLFLMSEQQRWEQSIASVQNLTSISGPPPHTEPVYLCETGISTKIFGSLAFLACPSAIVFRRAENDFWSWKTQGDSILLHHVQNPFVSSSSTSTSPISGTTTSMVSPYVRLSITAPSPCLSFTHFLQAQVSMYICGVVSADVVVYSPFGGAIMFKVSRNLPALNAIEGYISKFVSRYVNPVIPPPVSFWRNIDGQSVVETIKAEAEGDSVQIVSIFEAEKAELLIELARQRMTEWEVKRAENPFFPTASELKLMKKKNVDGLFIPSLS